jgi:hypothetical protein
MLNDECGWKDGDRSAVVLRTLREMRMELRQQRPGNRIGNTEMVACHFLQRDCIDLGHPSRLPHGSLRSARTGPGRDPRGFTHTRKWQALSRRRRCASRWSARNILSITNK